MALDWVSVDLRTGGLITDLTDLTCDKIKRTLGQYEPCTASLPLSTAPENWLDSTRQGAMALVCLQDEAPIWGGMITQRKRGTAATVDMTLATLEAYLNRRYVGDKTYTGQPQNTIVEDLIESYVQTGPLGGIPLRVQAEPSPSNMARDRTYYDKDDKTIYSVLTDLMGVQGGPEWTIEWEWQHDPERITPYIRVGDRVGVSPISGLGPAATFDLPGCVGVAEYVENYSDGQGANSVIATSSGQGDERPQSPPQVGADDGRPTYEYRWSPSTSITVVDTLTAHAQRALQLLAPGSTALTLTAARSAAPTLGVDWMLGDDIGADLRGPAFPIPVQQTARCIGWELDFKQDTVSPILYAPEAS